MQRPVMTTFNKLKEMGRYPENTHLHRFERHASDGADVAFLEAHEADGEFRVHDGLSQHSLLQSAIVDL